MGLFLPSPRQAPVGPARVAIEEQLLGTAQDWAKPAYGEYYAKSPFLYAAVKLRADAIVRAPLRVYRATPDGRELAEGHPLQRLLDLANPFWSSGDLWRATSIYLDLWGSAFWALTKASETLAPTEIWPLRPDQVKIFPDPESYIAGFEYRRHAKRVPLRPDEVVWFRLFNPLDEYAGLSPVAPARLSLDMAIDAAKHNRNQFRNDMLISNLWIKTEQYPTDAELEDFYARLRKRFAGPEQSFRPFVGAPGMEVKNLGFAPREMEHLQTLRFSLEDVARVYGVPKIMLGDLERSTYANFDSAERVFWRNMAVHLAFLQGEVNEMLAPQFGEGVYVEFDLSQVEALQEDMNRKSQRLIAEAQAGLRTINEIREELNLDPVPWGDQWWVPMTQMPVGAPGEGDGAAAFQAPTMAQLRADGFRRWSPPVLDEGNLKALYDGHAALVARLARRFAPRQRELFAAQRRDVLRRLRALKSFDSKQIGGELFSPDEWLRQFAGKGGPLFLGAVAEGGKGAVAEFGLGIAFDVRHPLVQEWLEDRARFWAGRVNEETAKLLMQELLEAQAAGESIKQVQERVEKVFAFNSEVRSERIARTEMQSATNRGHLEAYRQSGVVQEKRWLSTRDDRVRDWHAAMEGVTVPFEAPFLVPNPEGGVDEMQGPGDGPANQVINCRCRAIPVIKPAAKADGHEPTKALEAVQAALRESKDETRALKEATERALAEVKREMGKPKKRVKRVKRDEEGWPVELEEVESDA